MGNYTSLTQARKFTASDPLPVLLEHHAIAEHRFFRNGEALLELGRPRQIKSKPSRDRGGRVDTSFRIKRLPGETRLVLEVPG